MNGFEDYEVDNILDNAFNNIMYENDIEEEQFIQSVKRWLK